MVAGNIGVMNSDIRLLQISDSHLFASAQGTLRGVQSLASLQQVLAHVQRRRARVDAVLATGDIANDESGAYAHFRRLLGAWGKPVYCLPGNHDDPQRMQAELSDAPFQTCGHADLGAWRLIMLDSVLPGQAGGHLAEHELQRLDAALASASDRHALIALHHHPVHMASQWLDRIGVDNAAAFFSIIDRYAHVRAILWGHVHQSFDSRRKGVRLLATPATCAQFLPLASNFTVDQRPPAYRRLTLCADGSLETEVVWIDSAAAEFNERANTG